ncbi:SDR family NAD(P)-dependent oxidoreductase [Clostridium aminobutyricum]|uniref:SDR family oxidoreductase n=1 Tax=Clostridium aminobutyricum TaxID=33953 RepID=A0A939DB78_CLOAM|nr:SDR family oxidoreductase [Clostridium aminobutyricum]MBN7774063.1 SDR family oxidoreductase [Clostridium aminobutyricum]
MGDKKWIIVTGASSGIGKSTVCKLLESGFGIIATAREVQALEVLYRNQEDVKIIPWDLSDVATIKDYSKLVKEHAAVSGLLHCAGIQATTPIHLMKTEKLQEIFYINTFAAMMLVSQFSKKGMVDEEGASFVMVSSLAAHEGAFGKAMYAASKGALEGFVKASAPELAEKKIRINAVAPGVVQTRMVEQYFAQLTKEQKQATLGAYPLGLGQPEDVAEMAVFLLSEKSRWITGQTIVVDGGHTVRKC